MKKILFALFVAAFASTASATIAGSPHDLSAAGTPAIGSCQYCHAPHLWTTSAIGTGVPLWNKDPADINQAYTPYTSVNILANEITVGNGSKICLVCHGGTTAMGSTVNGTDTTAPAMLANSYGYVGTDLSNDHPVGIVYNTANALRDNGGTAAINNMKLFPSGANFTVECASCHDPHGSWDDARGGNAFLRGPGGSLDQCTACHDK